MTIVAELQEQIRKLQEQIHQIQASCSHPAPAQTYEFRANTGNYDPSADAYWTDYRCRLCGHTWTVDGSVAGPPGSTEIRR